MAEQVQLAIGDVQSAPLDYVVPNAQAIEPVAVNAVFDGSGAAGSFLPALVVISDSGHTVARMIVNTAVAAGGSAEVTFAPFLGRASSSSSSGSGVGGRYDTWLAGYGLLSETFRFEAQNGSRTTASGRVWYTPVGLLKGDVVSGFAVYNIAAGSNVSLFKMGLYATDGSSQLAVTASTPTAATTAGWNTIAATAAYTVPADGAYYIAQLVVFTTSSPTWPLSAGSGNGLYGHPRRTGYPSMYYTDAGPRADLPASFSPGTLGNPPVTVALNYAAVY